MKSILLTIAFSFISLCSYSQKIIRDNNTFIVNKITTKTEEIKTIYTYKDSKNNEYPIYITTKGTCYIKRISQKTGKEYKYYLPKEIQTTIQKELNITTTKP